MKKRFFSKANCLKNLCTRNKDLHLKLEISLKCQVMTFFGIYLTFGINFTFKRQKILFEKSLDSSGLIYLLKL